MNTLAHLIDRLFSAKTMISQQIDIIIELDTLARANTLRELVAHCLLHADFTPTQNRCLDIVGTGATGLKTVNISTPSALILSNLGYQVIKHGNRAITSACGAADIQERLGFHAPKTVDDAEQRIAMKESVFLYAPYFHPLLKRIQDARKQLKKKTIFNLLGPLINPARPPFRIIGVSSIDDMQPMAEVLAADASVTRAIVVHSCGLDELSTCGPNCILQIENTKITPFTLDTTEFGFKQSRIESIQGGDAKTNHALLYQAMHGDNNSIKDHLLLNVAMGIHLIEGGDDFHDTLRNTRDRFDKLATPFPKPGEYP